MADNDIEKLKLNEEALKILKRNKITTTEQLSNKTKSDLKKLGLLGYQISEIEIKLKLEMLELKQDTNK